MDQLSPLSSLESLESPEDSVSPSMTSISFDCDTDMATPPSYYQFSDALCGIDMDLFSELNSCPSSNDTLNYFTHPMAERLLQLYSKHFHPQWPLVDQAKIYNGDIPAQLALAMCCVGAMYDSDPESQNIAGAVVLVERPALLSQIVGTIYLLWERHPETELHLG